MERLIFIEPLPERPQVLWMAVFVDRNEREFLRIMIYKVLSQSLNNGNYRLLNKILRCLLMCIFLNETIRADFPLEIVIVVQTNVYRWYTLRKRTSSKLAKLPINDLRPPINRLIAVGCDRYPAAGVANIDFQPSGLISLGIRWDICGKRNREIMLGRVWFVRLILNNPITYL